MFRRGKMLFAGSFLLVATMVLISVGCSKPSTPAPPAVEKQAAPEKPASPAPEQPAQAKGEQPPVTPSPAPAAPPATPEKSASPQNASAQATPASQPASGGGKPKIVCDEPTFNFGERDADTDVEHTFILRNAGDATLEITEVKPGCGCTTANLETRTLAPGQQVKLAAKLSLKGRQGLQTKPIMVMSNDPETPSLQLTLTGTAIPAIEVDPPMVNFINVMDDNPREQTIRVVAKKEDLNFKVLEVTAQELDEFTYELKEVTPGKEYAIELKSKGALPEGSKNGRLIIRTDNQQRPAILVNVSTYVIGALKVMPNIINVRGSDVPGETEAMQISVMPGRIPAFELLEAVPPVEQIKTEIRKLSDNNYVVKLEGIPKDNSIEGKELVLKTNIPDKPEVKVPFHIFNFKPTIKGPTTPPAPPKPVAQPVTPPSGVPSPAGVVQQ
ncbi:MAG TPA: DUF1573 domain-containing protein [Candidatus Hydrogenedentes bacterium]|nr:DUF1573 domain-containing protein [Candidatus Hydrogenedentota bacterium]HOK88900.1 DUF1573 domain-containing protein [Candidatus Hydrogenedentota bacterium]